MKKSMQFIVPLRKIPALIISRSAPTALFSATRPQSTGDNFSCLGWDGSPLRGSVGKAETELQRREEVEEGREMMDYRQYCEKQKSITQATDHAGDEKKVFLLVRETVDDALRRAEEMWWAAKVRGDPDSPQGRALAKVLRERCNGKEHEGNIV